MKKKHIIFYILITFLIASPAYGFNEIILIGRDDNWLDMADLYNTWKKIGLHGYYDICLRERTYDDLSEKDLLLSFEGQGIIDEAGKYQLMYDGSHFTDRISKYGESAAAFENRGKPIELIPSKDSLFYPGSEWQDFTIEFWMYGANLQDGEVIIHWQGSIWEEGIVIDQELKCGIENRQIYFDFKNFFLPPGRENFTLSIKGTKALIPRKWHHHLIRFDSDTGLIEYVLDGKVENITYANVTRDETSGVYYPYIGESMNSKVLLGSKFIGFIDDFVISREFKESVDLRTYNQNLGIATTRVFDFEYVSSQVTSIDAVFDEPKDTDVFFYYKVSNDIGSFFVGDNVDTVNIVDNSGWVPFIPGEDLPLDLRGRYIQIRMELFADGTGSVSPTVSEISILYNENSPPPPPSHIIAVPGDGKVEIKWSPVAKENVRGYMVYYGTQPGVYLEKGSPIDVKKNTSLVIDNLENGKIYYFSVITYGDYFDEIHTGFSKEVNARPSRIYK